MSDAYLLEPITAVDEYNIDDNEISVSKLLGEST